MVTRTLLIKRYMYSRCSCQTAAQYMMLRAKKAVGVCTFSYCQRAATRSAEFVSFCDAFSIPVLTLTNVNGIKKLHVL